MSKLMRDLLNANLAKNKAKNALLEVDNNSEDEKDDKAIMHSKFAIAYLNQREKLLEFWNNGEHENAKSGLLKSKEFDSGAAKLDEHPRKTAVFYASQGKVYMRICHWKKALNAYNLAIELNPNNYEYYMEKAKICVSMHAWEQAFNAFNIAIKLNPHNPDHYADRAKVYMHQQELKPRLLALRAIDAAIMLNSKNHKYHNIRAKILRAMGRWDEAIQACHHAIALNPGKGNYYIARAEIWLRLCIINENPAARYLVRAYDDYEAALKCPLPELVKKHITDKVNSLENLITTFPEQKKPRAIQQKR